MKTNIYRGKRYYTSCLDIYKGEILTKYRTNSTVAEIRKWLEDKDVCVVWSTVYRFINKHIKEKQK